MRYIIPLLLILCIISISCTKDSEESLITYSTVIDSTFYCSIDLNGSSIIFPYQQYIGVSNKSMTSKVRLLKDDSVIYSYKLTYYTDITYLSSNKIYIEFSKKFKVTDLKNTIFNKKDSCYLLGDLSTEEFQSIFDTNNMRYSFYGSNYKCVLDGVSIICDTGNNILYSTATNSDTVKYYNGESNFKLLHVTKLEPNKLIVEGEFDLLLFNWCYQSQSSIRNGYFKGYIEK